VALYTRLLNILSKGEAFEVAPIVHAILAFLQWGGVAGELLSLPEWTSSNVDLLAARRTFRTSLLYE
jgi:hypothetical protein